MDRKPIGAHVAAVQGRRRSHAAGTHDPRPRRQRTRRDRRRTAITRSAQDQ